MIRLPALFHRPLGIWSQQVRMYTLAALFILLNFWVQLRWFGDPAARRWLFAYFALSLAAIFSHYIALLLVAAQGLGGLWFAAEAARRGTGRRRLGEWILVHAAIGLALIPWGLYLLHGVPHFQFTAPKPLPVGLYLQVVASVLTLGVSTHLETYRPWVGLLLVLGAAWLPQLLAKSVTGRFASRQVLLNLLLPVSLIYVLTHLRSAQLFRPKFDSRYLLILAPFALLVLAWGLRQWSRWNKALGFAVASAVVLVQIGRLPGYYGSRRATADFAGLMRALTNLARPGDAVLVYTDKDWPVFEYHNRTGLRWTGIPNRATLTPEEVARLVDPLAEGHTSIWTVITPDSVALDPARAILARLAEHYPLAADRTYGDYRLQLYTKEVRSLSRTALAPRPGVRINRPIPSASEIRLLGYDMPVREVSPGDFFPITLYWQAPPDALPTIWSLQLLDPHGGILREAAGPLTPDGNFAEISFPISSAWKTGRYRLRWRIPAGEGASNGREFSIDLASLVLRNVVRPGLPPEQIANPQAADFQGLIWLEGSSELPEALEPGEQLSLTLYWRAQREVSTNYTVFVHLLGEEFNPATGNFLWGQADREPAAGASPTSGWVAGQTLSDPYVVQLSPDAPPGMYLVEVGLYDHSTGERLKVRDQSGAGPDHVILGSFQVP